LQKDLIRGWITYCN